MKRNALNEKEFLFLFIEHVQNWDKMIKEFSVSVKQESYIILQ